MKKLINVMVTLPATRLLMSKTQSARPTQRVKQYLRRNVSGQDISSGGFIYTVSF